MANQIETFDAMLQEAIALAEDMATHDAAKARFQELHAQLEATNPDAAHLLQILWERHIRLQRSAAFWQQISDAEKELSQRMTETSIQLKQNYMRLIQEQ